MKKASKTRRAHVLLAAGAGVGVVMFTGMFMSGCGSQCPVIADGSCYNPPPEEAGPDAQDAMSDSPKDSPTDVKSDAPTDAAIDAPSDAPSDSSNDGPIDAPKG